MYHWTDSPASPSSAARNKDNEGETLEQGEERQVKRDGERAVTRVTRPERKRDVQKPIHESELLSATLIRCEAQLRSASDMRGFHPDRPGARRC